MIKKLFKKEGLCPKKLKKKSKRKVDEEVTEELTEEALEDIVEEEINELDEAQKLATEWENKFLRVSAEMQNVQRRGNEERLQLVKYRSQDLAKKSCLH